MAATEASRTDFGSAHLVHLTFRLPLYLSVDQGVDPLNEIFTVHLSGGYSTGSGDGKERERRGNPPVCVCVHADR